jgi:DNA polymerase-3 subunit delta'
MSNATTATWSALIGHDVLRDGFAAAIEQNRLGGSFLLVGPGGTGKHTVARLLALTLLCHESTPDRMNPCGRCASCQQVLAGTHPDVITVRKPDDKTVIPLELLIGERDVRMQSGFCHDIRIKPLAGNRKIAILDDADYLNEEGANCLLKTLEEPPPGALIMLIGSSEQRQLPTIRSRCQTVRVGPLPMRDAVRVLREVHAIEADEAELRDAVEISGGDLHAAARLLQGDSQSLRESMGSRLREADPDPLPIVNLINEVVAEAGKEAPQRRAALRDLFLIAVQHYRQKLREEALQNRPQQNTLARLDRSLRALREVDRNANQSTLIECFATDLFYATTGDRGEIG